jgi:hypothetical protein
LLLQAHVALIVIENAIHRAANVAEGIIIAGKERAISLGQQVLISVFVRRPAVAQYPDDGPEAMAKEAKESGYVFPYLFDESQEVARAFDAACTPDLYIYDARGLLAYRGQFDESRPKSSLPVTGQDARAAVEALLAGRSPATDQKPSIGCNIKWKAN